MADALCAFGVSHHWPEGARSFTTVDCSANFISSAQEGEQVIGHRVAAAPRADDAGLGRHGDQRDDRAADGVVPLHPADPVLTGRPVRRPAPGRSPCGAVRRVGVGSSRPAGRRQRPRRVGADGRGAPALRRHSAHRSVPAAPERSRQALVEGGRIRALDEVADDAHEARRVGVVGEVPGLVEDLELAPGQARSGPGGRARAG